MHWLPLRGTDFLLLWPSQAETIRAEPSRMQVAVTSRVSKTLTSCWPLATRCQTRTQTGREPGRCHGENGNMMNCKNYVCSAQCTTELICMSNKIQQQNQVLWSTQAKKMSSTHPKHLFCPLATAQKFYPTNSILSSKKIINQWTTIELYNSNNSKTTSMSKFGQLPLTG